MPYVPLSTPRLTPAEVLNRLVRLTSKSSGLSAVFMLTQYSSPLVINFLLFLARLRAKHQPGGGKSLSRAAQGWGNVATSMAETRLVMRLAGESRFGPSFISSTSHDPFDSAMPMELLIPPHDPT